MNICCTFNYEPNKKRVNKNDTLIIIDDYLFHNIGRIFGT